MLARTFLQTTHIGDSLFLIPDENVTALDRHALGAELAAVSNTLCLHTPQIRHVIADLSSLSHLTAPLIETFLTVSTEMSVALRSFTLCHLRAEMSHVLRQLELLDAPHRPGNWREAPTRFAAFKARDDERTTQPGPEQVSAANGSHRGDIRLFTIKQHWPIWSDYGVPAFRTKANLFQLLIQDNDDKWFLIRQRTSPKSRSIVPRSYRKLSEDAVTCWLGQHHQTQAHHCSNAASPQPLPVPESISSPLSNG